MRAEAEPREGAAIQEWMRWPSAACRRARSESALPHARGTPHESAELQGHVIDAVWRRRRRAGEFRDLRDRRLGREGCHLLEEKSVSEIARRSRKRRAPRATAGATGHQDRCARVGAKSAGLRPGCMRVMRVHGRRLGAARMAACMLGLHGGTGDPKGGHLQSDQHPGNQAAEQSLHLKFRIATPHTFVDKFILFICYSS